MKSHALISLANRIMDAPSKGVATEIGGNVGADYSDFIWKLINRLTWGRSLSQNALLHMWFAEIAKHYGDRTPDDVKGYCHQRWALPIRLQDKKFEWVWERSGAKLTYEQQCSLLASGVLGVSSGMTTAQLKRYLDEIGQHYRFEGVTLTDPEDRK